MADPYELERFVIAQEPCYADVVAELRAGRKSTHWMWFVFPQLRGLGSSAYAIRFGIGSLAEAQAYERHTVLGARLHECVAIVLALGGRTAHQIFGSPDDAKFRSSMTLFALAAPASPAFRSALATYYGGEEDPRTVELLSGRR